MEMLKRFRYASLLAVTVLGGLMGGCGTDTQPAATSATLLYSSDAHYGIKRASGYAFSSYTGAKALGGPVLGGYSSAQQVNTAMAYVMKGMIGKKIPNDGIDNVGAGTTIGNIDYVIQSGDISNRMQNDFASTGYTTWVQSAYDSWNQFMAGFVGVHKFNTLLVPGNHDVSNAIGYTKPLSRDGSASVTGASTTLTPLDGSIMAYIYNWFVKPGTFDTSSKDSAQKSYVNATYQNADNKIYYSKDIAGVHFMFISMWPDLDAQAWMEGDLARISSTTPAVIVTHDGPTTEAKHLTSQNGPTDFGNTYENLLVNAGVVPYSATANIGAQRDFVRFLQRHKNIVAYFHGNDNWNDIGTCDASGVYQTGDAANTTGCYQGPDAATNPVYLPTFRVDSPMKGRDSGQDKYTTTPGLNFNSDLLSYQVISIDSVAKKMTVREYRWKTGKWGNTPTNSVATISLAPRAK
jgi:hypothetical protein